MSESLDAQAVVDEIRGRPSEDALRIFWVQLWTQNREEFAAEMSKADDDHDRIAVPWVLRTRSLFMDANSVMADVSTVLEETRPALERIVAVGIDLVLLTRRELAVVDASSPIELPTWYPVAGAKGETVTTTVQDLTWEVATSVADGALMLEDISRLLYGLDEAMLSRLRRALASSRRKVQSVEALLFPGSSMAEDLVRVEAALNKARVSRTRFRPSTRPERDDSIVARVWRLVNRTSPDRLAKGAKALAGALEPTLDTDNQPLAAPLISVLNRTSNPIPDDAERWCFNLMIAVRAACQMLTAAAHAEEYPRFPVILLKSMSRDVRRFLDRAVTTLQAP